MWVLSLSREDPLEKEMAAHSNILAWEIPWTEEPGGNNRVRHNFVTKNNDSKRLMPGTPQEV